MKREAQLRNNDAYACRHGNSPRKVRGHWVWAALSIKPPHRWYGKLWCVSSRWFGEVPVCSADPEVQRGCSAIH